MKKTISLIGHENSKKQLNIAIESAHKRNEAPPHMLFSGLAGCGKTSMAKEVAYLLGTDFISIMPDEMTDADSVMKLLNKLDTSSYDEYGNRIGRIKPTVVFFDEIHRMPRKGQEILGIAMEKFLLETGKANKFYWIPYFTMIGATTDDGELSKPFREKFKIRLIFEAYSIDEMHEIIKHHAREKALVLTGKATTAIAKRSRGVPRIAVKYIEGVRDLASHRDAVIVTSKVAEDFFEIAGIDSRGLTTTEIRILKTLYGTREPIGLDNLAIITNESRKNILNTIEPFLIQQGLVLRSGRGRIITDVGRAHLENDGYLKGSIKQRLEIPGEYVRK